MRTRNITYTVIILSIVFISITTGFACNKTSGLGSAFETSNNNNINSDTNDTNKTTSDVSVILGAPSKNAVAFNILTSNSSNLEIKYGTTQGEYRNGLTGITTVAKVPIEKQLTGLSPDEEYFYRILSKQTGSTSFQIVKEGRFHTARPAGSSFVFTIQADPHMDENSDAETYKQTLNNILNDKPDFMIDLGDTFMTDKLEVKSEQNILERYLLMRKYFDIPCSSVPLLLTIGNHDGEAGWDYNASDSSLANFSHNFRLAYFPNPNPNSFFSGNNEKENGNYLKDYYSFIWGDTLFIVLDPYRYTEYKPNSDGWEWTLGKTQYDWLKYTLENSNTKFKFIFIHQLVGGDNQGRGGIEYVPYYEWGGDNIDKTSGFTTYRSGWSKPIHQLLVDSKVDVVFKGHDHFFAKQDLDGIIYQTVPQPSHPGDKVNTAEEYGYLNGDIIGGSGYLRVTVNPSTVKVEFIRFDGSVCTFYDLD